MDLLEQYYPDWNATYVEGLWMAQARSYLELQKNSNTNGLEVEIITISTDNNSENCSVTIENLAGNFSSTGQFVIYEPMTHDFTPGTGSWPFGESTPINALVNLGWFLHQQELNLDINEKNYKIFDFQISSNLELGANSFNLNFNATNLPLKLALGQDKEVASVKPWLLGSI